MLDPNTVQSCRSSGLLRCFGIIPDIMEGCLSIFLMHVLTPSTTFKTCGGPEAVTPSAFFTKHDAKTGLGRQERYIV